MYKNINLWIDNRPVRVTLGYTLMRSCAVLGVEIPRFCYHDKLMIAGNCRICLVEIVGSKKLVASCAIHATEKARIFTNSARVRVARQNVLEFLLANHPLDCPICDQGGECDLQDITMVFGADRGRFYEYNKRAVLNKDFGPLIKTSMNRCIHCTRCVRFLAQVSGFSVIGTLGRGSSTEIGTYIGQFLDNELSGNITDLCPVGALTSKPYAFKVRPWELASIESIDIFDAVNSSVFLDIAANKIYRVLPYLNDRINEDWLTNKARYSYDGLFMQRLNSCFIKVNFNQIFMFNGFLKVGVDFFVKVSLDSACAIFFERLFEGAGAVRAYIGSLADLKTTVAAKSFFSLLGVGCTYSLYTRNYFPADFSFLFLFNTALSDLAKTPSFCMLLGANPKFEAPILNLKINKLVSEFSVPVYSIGLGSDYLSFPVFVISNSLFSFLKICEFRHPFCKNFYLPVFSSAPLFIVGPAAVFREDAFTLLSSLVAFCYRIFYVLNGFSRFFLTFFSKKANFSLYRYIGVLHLYSGYIHAMEVGFVPGVAEFGLLGSGVVLARRPSFSVVYAVASEEAGFSQFFSTSAHSCWLIYQGSHGNGLASFANLVFPVSVCFERDFINKNLNGICKKSSLAINALFSLKTDLEMFLAISEFWLFELRTKFFSFKFFNGIRYYLCFNRPFFFYANSVAPFLLAFAAHFTLAGDHFFKSYRWVFFFGGLRFLKHGLLSDISMWVILFHFGTLILSIRRTPLNPAILNYYGDAADNVVRSSKTMNLSANLFLKKNISFFLS